MKLHRKPLLFLFFIALFFGNTALGEQVYIFGKLCDTENTKIFIIEDEMTHWPNELFLLKNLEELVIKSRHIFHIPDEVSNFLKLERLSLYVASHEITHVSPALGELVQLKELSLNLRNLKLLPQSLSKLKRLETLSVAGENTKSKFGKFETIGDEITYLESLIKPIPLRWLYINGASVKASKMLIPLDADRSGAFH